MADGSLLPPSEKDSLTPEIVADNADSTHREALPSYGIRKAVFAFSVVGLLGFTGWLFQNFLQLRGVVDLVASRIDLAAMWVTLFLVVWLFTLNRPRRVLLRGLAGFFLLTGMRLLDAWAPKPQAKLVAVAVPGQIRLEDQNLLLRDRSDLLSAQVRVLESPEYRTAQELEKRLKSSMVLLEKKGNCIVDGKDDANLQCFPGAPSNISGTGVAVEVLQFFLSESGNEARFWLVHNKFRSPAELALKLQFSNKQDDPVKIDHLTLEYLAPKGWRQLRRVGYFSMDRSFGRGEIIFALPQYALPAYLVAGGNLYPRLYENQIAPHRTLEGWWLAEVPPEVKRAGSLGAIRVSVSANGFWVARTSAEPHVLAAGQQPEIDKSKQPQVLDGLLLEQ